MPISLKKTYTGYGFDLTVHEGGLIDVIVPNGTFDKPGFNLFIKDLLEVQALVNSIDPAYIEQAKALVAAHKKLEAVKLIKSHTDLGLKECKDIADKLQEQIAEELHKIPDNQID